MMARIRDYAREYARRIARGAARGLSRSQARGHPRAGEQPIIRRREAIYDPHLEEGVRLIREGSSAKFAAKTIKASPERLAEYLQVTGIGRKEKGRWTVRRDLRRREVQTFSRRRAVIVTLGGFDEASKWGAYMSAVGQLIDNNNPNTLAAFEGDGLTDIHGDYWPFETRPNVLYRLKLVEPEAYELIYKIVT